MLGEVGVGVGGDLSPGPKAVDRKAHPSVASVSASTLQLFQ